MVVILFILLSLVIFSSCQEKENSWLEGFKETVDLNVSDSVLIDDYGILNPHYIYFKDSFLIFSSIRGDREIQFLNLRDYSTRNYSVIGQGKNEMANYFAVPTADQRCFKFADNARGRVYGVDVASLQHDTLTDYRLLYELPVHENVHFIRFVEFKGHVVGTGILQDGRFGVYDTSTFEYSEQESYPDSPSVYSLDNRYKGALFSRTLLAADKKGERMVAACFGLLDFYQLSSDGQLRLIHVHHYHYPEFTQDPVGGGAIGISREDKVGITGLVADDRYVYALYSDKTFGQDGEKSYNASHLLVYDWSGTPVKHYRLSRDLYGIALSGNTLYGLCRVDEPIVYCCQLDS